MIPQEEIKNMKVLVGQFHEEMKSNSMSDFMIWLDCKLELTKKRETEMRKLRKPL
jgi:uncharacterized protein YecT (DUF1311 family)